MVIKKSDRILEVDERGVKIYDYDLKTDKLGIAFDELEGRVPADGQEVNKEVDQWYFVVSGTGTVTIDGTEDAIDEGDVIYLPQGCKSFLQANSLKLLTITKPDWYESQNEIVV